MEAQLELLQRQAVAPPRNRRGVSETKLPLLSVFQTVNWLLPGTVQATS